MSESQNSNRPRSLKLVPSTRGRIGRKDYLFSFMFWSCIIFLSCLMGLFLLMLNIGFGVNYGQFNTGLVNIIWITSIAALFVYALCHLWAITVRRLHDINLSGGWAFPLFIPFLVETWFFITVALPGTLTCTIGWLAGNTCASVFKVQLAFSTWILAAVIYAMVGFWWLLIFFMPETPIPNRFGDVSPKFCKSKMATIFGVLATLIIAALPGFIIAFMYMVLDAMRGWHC